VVSIRRFFSESDGQVGHHGSHEIQTGVGRFGKDAEATRAQANDNFENSQAHSRNHRSQGCRFLFMGAILRKIRNRRRQLIPR
jgi:hypothetical protein